MAWNKNIPQGTDKISQSPTPIRGNWQYIETTLKNDHFYADSSPGNDGHHHFAQFDTPALIPTLDGANGFFGGLYAKQIGATKGVPYWNLASTTEVLQLVTNFSVAIADTGNTTSAPLYDFGSAGLPSMTGFLFLYQHNLHNRTIFSPFVYDVASGVLVPGDKGQLISSVSEWQQFFVDTVGSPYVLRLNSTNKHYNVNLRIYGNVVS